MGQLGDGTTADEVAPTAVIGGLLFESLAAGAYYSTYDYDYFAPIASFTCGVATGGNAYCWRSGIRGQLRTGANPVMATTPQPVASAISFTGLRAGTTHVCGLAIGGAAYCGGTYSAGLEYGGVISDSDKPMPLFGP
ncbi:MAG: hypothetical protein ABR582_02335 [Gemmatimonadaceae bacterium]